MVRGLRGRWREELPASPWGWLLLPAWLLFRPLVILRNAAFDLGWRRIHRLRAPVWSVGNLAAGGTGKTPLTRYLAAWALEHGRRPAIVSRGYGGDGAANDEARLVSECPVVCDADRVAGGRRALQAGADCLILDDGFQHRRLHRDLDLVLIDATRPWGATLPLGYLREGRAALRRAHALVVTRAALVDEQARGRLLAELAATGKPVIRVDEDQATLRPLHGGDDRSVAALAGRAVVLVSGIGNPLGFERAAAAHGWRVVESLRFPDHHHYDRADAGHLVDLARRHGAEVVMTGKDAVKLRPLLDAAIGGIHVLESRSAVATEDRATLDALLRATLAAPGT
jgi:tetraacyldisaccharide 4'-kinase